MISLLQSGHFTKNISSVIVPCQCCCLRFSPFPRMCTAVWRGCSLIGGLTFQPGNDWRTQAQADKPIYNPLSVAPVAQRDRSTATQRPQLLHLGIICPGRVACHFLLIPVSSCCYSDRKVGLFCFCRSIPNSQVRICFAVF